jgi:general secretion pathway protein D
LCLIAFSSYAYDLNKDISLIDFANKVSISNDVNIVIDEDLNTSISFSFPSVKKEKDLFNIFKIMLSKKGFNLKKLGDIYYLTKKVKYKVNSYLYNLKYNSFDDCSKLLDSIGVKYTYLNDINSILISSTKNDYTRLKSFLDRVDVKQNQVILKIMVFEHSDDDVSDIGFKYGSTYTSATNEREIAINSILFPISSNVHKLSDINFYGAVKFLNEHNILHAKQFPYILAKNNKKFLFEAVENLPFLVTTTTTEATNTSEQNSIEYRDVGLKINGLSLIHKDYITLDIDLVIEDLVNGTVLSATPQTYKRHIQSNTNINYNEVLLLSGLKRTKHTVTDFNVPFISNIPYLGELFKYKSKNDTEINITIAIEVIKSKDFNNFKVINNISDINTTDYDYNSTISPYASEKI